ncbi:hypothetical protein [Youngiibacter fragilis]|uniref:Uncharacterized protein n=1 Tax=Youngiibacter fragilis 232.1 TaxID=994573 RepID=V7I401_9CLOT|nr:hypothetical protein [Youngiibacter fragilis]ETA79707.1 hypothetical protein T472_0215630 [Youngiibacter fragilis 232.1]
MNTQAIIGILLIVYAGLVVMLTLKKPESIWSMKKIQLFEKVLGVKGTEIFFYVIAAIAGAVGVYLMLK